MNRYAYSGEAVEEGDEEAQSLTNGASEGDIGLTKLDKDRNNLDPARAFRLDDEEEEDKQE